MRRLDTLVNFTGAFVEWEHSRFCKTLPFKYAQPPTLPEHLGGLHGRCVLSKDAQNNAGFDNACCGGLVRAQKNVALDDIGSGGSAAGASVGSVADGEGEAGANVAPNRTVSAASVDGSEISTADEGTIGPLQRFESTTNKRSAAVPPSHLVRPKPRSRGLMSTDGGVELFYTVNLPTKEQFNQKKPPRPVSPNSESAPVSPSSDVRELAPLRARNSFCNPRASSSVSCDCDPTSYPGAPLGDRDPASGQDTDGDREPPKLPAKCSSNASDSLGVQCYSDPQFSASTSSSETKWLQVYATARIPAHSCTDDMIRAPCDDDMMPCAWDDFGTPSVFTEMPSVNHSRILSRRPSGGVTPNPQGHAAKTPQDDLWGSAQQHGRLDPNALRLKIESLQSETGRGLQGGKQSDAL
eukprot:GEMP01044021.1.p1 GENE.GEMP01044021.1~~GEMP01044021.1.p1  ORF type:complete len:410 (+),score=75.87 GEMP01044021.1:128-1357(+)